MIFNILLFLSTLAFVATRAVAGVVSMDWGNVSSPEVVGTPSNATTPIVCSFFYTYWEVILMCWHCCLERHSWWHPVLPGRRLGKLYLHSAAIKHVYRDDRGLERLYLEYRTGQWNRRAYFLLTYTAFVSPTNINLYRSFYSSISLSLIVRWTERANFFSPTAIPIAKGTKHRSSSPEAPTSSVLAGTTPSPVSKCSRYKGHCVSPVVFFEFFTPKFLDVWIISFHCSS